MAKRQRDYRKEYARRVAVASQKGLSRSAARGHPKAGERQKPPSTKTVYPYSREEQALRMMRRGSSLRDAANHYRMSQERLRSYLKENVSLARLDQKATSMSDTECAQKMATAKASLLRKVKSESPIPPRFH